MRGVESRPGSGSLSLSLSVSCGRNIVAFNNYVADILSQ